MLRGPARRPSISGARYACVIMVRGPIRYGMRYSATSLYYYAAFTSIVLQFSAFHYTIDTSARTFRSAIMRNAYVTYMYVIPRSVRVLGSKVDGR